ncbi:ATP-binding protein [Psychromonas sp. SR45-3]|uniref:ATP-binding protein n=1 Tax=Psychromonas sp. SR45-3 TaxID=2760930 RepID=UPI0015F7D4F7|nr:ATP-binding protein [Psychromonas sp. SR45-3]MBB1274315.1 ATP-binding protein [Psychromonas sp. SR45-3]
MNHNPTYLGKITSVSGASVNVELTQQVRSGLLIIEGKTHRIGQVGSFIRIPQGYNSLFGVISETIETSVNYEELGNEKRVIKVELVGESIGYDFERGISQFPSISEEVHLVTEDDLKKIYGEKSNGQIIIGKLSSSDSINVSVDLDSLVSRHSAVLGSTGSGKSTSVASLIRSIVTSHDSKVIMPSARIVLFDIHGEYASALGDISNVFSITPTGKEDNFYIPYWCVSPYSLCNFLCGQNESLSNKFMELVLKDKRDYAKTHIELNIDPVKVTAMTPLPFRLRKIWYELVHYDNVNYNEKEKINPSYSDKGNSEDLIAPIFNPPGASSNPPHKGGNQVWRKQLEQMRSILLDSQYSFLLIPGDWNPDVNNEIKKDLPELISTWLSNGKPICILDLSGMPSSRLELLLGSVIEVLFESAIWGRYLDEGMNEKPLLLIMEEAHRYLSNENNGLAKDMVRRIAKEGRKFGVGSMLISQRPSEIDETILSQCGTLFSLRINNATDRARVKSAMADGLSGIIDALPILRTGEAIVTGEAAKLPMRFKFKIPQEGQFPDSKDPKVADSWSKEYQKSDFKSLVNCWRLQDVKPKPIIIKII